MTTITREEVLMLAMERAIDGYGAILGSEGDVSWSFEFDLPSIEAFANSIYQLGIAEGERREREACLQSVLMEHLDGGDYSTKPIDDIAYDLAVEHCAAAIRARGGKEAG